MIELFLIAQLVYDTEMDDPRVLECAAQVGVAPESRYFTYTEFQEFLQCRRDNGSFEGSRYDVV